MQNNIIEVPTNKERFLKDYLKVLSGVLNLTGKELECLTEMIIINKNFTATTKIRKQLVDKMELRNVPALNNIIKALKDKGVIKEDRNERHYVYNPIVIPSSLELKFVFKV